MKFVVGIFLTGFGTFWGAEGAGARWPLGDAALPVVVAGVGALAIGLVATLRRTLPPQHPLEAPSPVTAS